MSQSLITISSGVSQFQKDFLIKSGFIMASNGTYVRNVKNEQLHLVIAQLAKQSIPFNLKMGHANYTQQPCVGCKK